MAIAPLVDAMEMTMKDHAQAQRPETIAVLDKFLRGELAAAATYEQALEHIESPKAMATLKQNRDSHAARAVTLAQQIRARGGEPSESAGPWGVFTKMVEAGASVIGDDAIVRTLEEGEVQGLRTYETETPRLADDAAIEIWRHVLGEQQKTETRMRQLELS